MCTRKSAGRFQIDPRSAPATVKPFLERVQISLATGRPGPFHLRAKRFGGLAVALAKAVGPGWVAYRMPSPR
jgi:hypothetical protein